MNDRADRVERFFNVPVIVAALLSLPVIVIEETAAGDTLKAIAAVLNWAIWIVFVAELVAVRTEERSWEASSEMVLRGFALSLLVPQRHYQLVSAYVDRNRLRCA